MPRVQVGYNPGAEALQTTASPNIQAVKAQYDPRASSAFQLAEALGKAQPMLDKFNEDLKADQRRQEILDTMKIPSLVEKARQESTDGTLKGIQDGVIAPGSSAVVNARVDEARGEAWGKESVQALITKINGDATMIEDPVARAKAIAEGKAEILARIPKGNEYIYGGAATAVNKELNQYENGWMEKSNRYKTDMESKGFSAKVVAAFKTDNPSDKLLELDDSYKLSGLGNNARNKLVVDTVTQQAYGERNSALLDKIPERFLNAETKAKITQVRSQIQELKMGDYRAVKALEADQRDAAIRSGKTEIIKRVAAGQPVDPGQYETNPELYQFASTMREAPRLPAAQSSANLQRIRQSILSSATVVGVDANKLMDEALKNPLLNPADREKLVNEMPKLVDGMVAMNDDQVKSAYITRIGNSLDDLAKNPLSVLSPNLRSRTVEIFDTRIRQGFNAFYEEKGTWPTGGFKTKIVDEAVKVTEDFMKDQLNPGGRGAAPAATPAPKAPAATPNAVRKYNPATGKIE